jgi:diguanylate cyclase (GGDEF)-like protein
MTTRGRMASIVPGELDRGSDASEPRLLAPLRRQFVLRALERRLGFALEAAAAVRSLQSPAELIALLPGLRDLCFAESTQLYLLDSGRLICTAEFPPVAAGHHKACTDNPADEIERAVAAGRPAIIEPTIRPMPPGARQPGWMVLPLMGGGVTHGALVLQRRELFGGEDLTVMTVYTALLGERMTSAGRAAHVDRQQHELEQHLLSQRRLLEINERLLSNVDPAGVLELIADSLKTLVAYDNLTIYRVDRGAGVLRAVLARDRFAALILSTTQATDCGITGWVLAHGAAECVNDAHLDPRANLIPGTLMEVESLVVVPLRVGGEVVGTLNVGRMGEAGHFNAREFELVQLLAGQASIALANVEAHRALWTRAETDALTGLRNRGAFEKDLERLLADFREAPVLLLMLDLDNFKRYNDRHGHPAGDRVLRAVGAAIAAVGGVGYRYGGDEFAVIVPKGTSAHESEIIERLATGLATILPAGETPLTASVGAAWFLQAGPTKDALVAAADEALYRAKAKAKAGGLDADLTVPRANQ